MQRDPTDPLLQLAAVIPWQDVDHAFARHYSQHVGAASKPVRLVVGLFMLKSLEELSDEWVVVQWKRDACYQAFCGMTECQKEVPCHATERVHFRKRMGQEGDEKICRLRIASHGKATRGKSVTLRYKGTGKKRHVRSSDAEPLPTY